MWVFLNKCIIKAWPLLEPFTNSTISEKMYSQSLTTKQWGYYNCQPNSLDSQSNWPANVWSGINQLSLYVNCRISLSNLVQKDQTFVLIRMNPCYKRIANYNTNTLLDELEWRKSGNSQLKWRDIPSINDKQITKKPQKNHIPKHEVEVFNTQNVIPKK